MKTKRLILSAVIILAFQVLVLLFFAPINNSLALEGSQIKITILYDNYVFLKDTKSGWGFSCIIQGMDKTILFDTGEHQRVWFHNINKLKVNPRDVDLIVISHNHPDHTGGLFSFLEKNNRVSVYVPASYPNYLVRLVEAFGAKIFRVDGSLEISGDVFLTGEMGDGVKEHSLIVNTNQGLIVITGCAHPGIVNILKRAKKIVNRKVYLVLGGFHLREKSNEEVKEIISDLKDLGILKVGPTHCTGDKAIELFKKEYGDLFVQMGVGRVIEANRLTH
jgi:7,8-dihydropterin-6-yl-methyl-4-(beta-D-ribofuranosyl)aminobenzene 5'-phosphate synthase